MPSERVRWESIWPALATVDSTGLVSAIRSGHAEIAAVWTDQVDAKEERLRLAIGDTAFLARVPLGGWPWAIAQSPRGVVYVTQDVAGQVSRLSLSPPGVSVTFAVGATPRAISFTPDGARAFVALHTEPAIAVLDVVGDSVIARYPVQARVYDVAAMPDSTAYFLTDWGSATTCFFRLDPDASDPIIPIVLAGQWSSLARDPTRPIIYVSGIGGITLFRTDTQQFTNEGLGAGITGRLAVTPDGGKLLGFGEEGVEVWDLTTLTLTGTIPTWGSGIALTTDAQRAYIPQWGYGDVVIVDVPHLAVVRYMFLGDSPRDAVLVNDSLLLVTNESGWVDYVRAER
jgi:DNA-binding beta-propeller fold protein YncE